MKAQIRKILNAYDNLNSREKPFVLITGIVLLALCVYYPISWSRDFVKNTRNSKNYKLSQLDEAAVLSQRYDLLNTKLTAAQNSFDKAQMTYEQVTAEIDKIIKETVGQEVKYDLKNQNPSNLGLEFEKQEFSLSLKANLDQLVKLLFQFEKGETPLFLGKVNIRKVGKKDQFNTVLEVFSVRKKKA